MCENSGSKEFGGAEGRNQDAVAMLRKCSGVAAV